MKILIITACTGKKTVKHDDALTLTDFLKDRDHLNNCHKKLKDYLTPAKDLYCGDQHVRLTEGIQSISENKSNHNINLWVLSAGYGLIKGDQKIAPYECTFQGMKVKQLKALAEKRNIPEHFRRLVSEPYDFGLILLGDSYLKSCAIDETVKFAGPTLMFCGTQTARKLPNFENLKVVAISNPEAKRFSCGLVGLKGELSKRTLSLIHSQNDFLSIIMTQKADVLSALDPISLSKKTKNPVKKKAVATKKKQSLPNPKVDHIIQIPKEWWNKTHRKKLRYFIPEWDDLVDPDYDFINDVHSGGIGDWANEVYAHQMYPEPNYDGILVSRAVAEKSKKKAARINEMGVHRYVRIPRSYPIMGDCGAFDYINEEVPPYSTDDVIDYYTRLGFDLGVSVDHLIVTASEKQKKFRYELTINNAEEFLKENKKRQLQWEPIGAVQGWDPKSYANAARQYVAMGYKRLGIGGLVRSSTKAILPILEEIKKVVPDGIDIHLFGLARLNAMNEFIKYGVTSVDNASALRRAWLGGKDNYWSEDGEHYRAIRIPQGDKSFRAKRMVSEGRATSSFVNKIEKKCLITLREYDLGKSKIDDVLDTLDEYDHLITPDRSTMREEYRRTLEAKPWKICACDICKKDGVEVIIFRGNNRNRRRGFHNTFIFYKLLQRVIAGENIVLNGKKIYGEQKQLKLF